MGGETTRSENDPPQRGSPKGTRGWFGLAQFGCVPPLSAPSVPPPFVMPNPKLLQTSKPRAIEQMDYLNNSEGVQFVRSISPSPSPMVHYKLHYFDLAGRGEPMRMLFHYAGQPFEDVRVKVQDWPSAKSTFPFGQVPVLEVDGKVLTQSVAIGLHLARRFGLAGEDDWGQAKVAEAVLYLYDVGSDLFPYLGAKIGYRPDLNAEQLRKDAFVPGVAKHFPQIVRLLDESGSGFLLPTGLTYADLVCASFLSIVRQTEPEVLSEQYPKLAEFLERVHSVPKLRDYFKKCD